MIRILGTVFAGVLGLAFGSFLNVCASRWPDEKSVRKGRSHCDSCERELEWWENIPLASWLALHGKCRTCKASIGWRHPVAELAVGVLWAMAVWQFVSTYPVPHFSDLTYATEFANVICRLVFLWLLVALTVTDAEHLWLPDRLILPGLGLGLLLGVIRGLLTAFLQFHGGFEHLVATGAATWFLSAVFSAAVVLIIRWVYIMIRGQEGLGLGDVKLLAMIGGWVGFKSAMLAFGIGVLTCAGYALLLLSTPEVRADKKAWAQKKLPLGAFVCFGGVIAGFWGIPIVAAFLSWSGH